MKNEHIKSKDEVPTQLRLEVYKEVLEKHNWRNNEDGLCYLLTMYLWGFSYATEAYNTIHHFYMNTELMFPELVDELRKINRAENKNKVRVNALKRMIKKVEKDLVD